MLPKHLEKTQLEMRLSSKASQHLVGTRESVTGERVLRITTRDRLEKEASIRCDINYMEWNENSAKKSLYFVKVKTTEM